MQSNSKRKNGREVLQKGKNGKRRKEWHRGSIESAKWEKIQAEIEAAFQRAGVKGS